MSGIELLLLIKVSIFLFSLAVLAYFAGIETALTSISAHELSKIKIENPKKEKVIDFWHNRPNEILASILVGTNLAVIGAGVIAASVMIDIMARYPLNHKMLAVVFPAVATLIILVFGEIVPKIVSRYKAKNIALSGLGFLIFFSKIISPVTRILVRISERIIKAFGQKTVCESPFIKPDELRTIFLLDDALPLSKPERLIIDNIFDFGKTRISHVMVPRPDIKAVNLNQDPKSVIGQIVDSGYSRVPVYKGHLDNITGIVYSRDLTLALRDETLFLIDDLIRPAYFVPETARIDRVLREFKAGHYHMALVVDEFGSTIGLATIEDLVEEIVGEIWDEYDIQEKTVFPMPDGSNLIKASESLEKINDELNLKLPFTEFSTINGWILDLFGKIPKTGEKIIWGDLEVEIADADRKKINKVKIKKLRQNNE